MLTVRFPVQLQQPYKLATLFVAHFQYRFFFLFQKRGDNVVTEPTPFFRQGNSLVFPVLRQFLHFHDPVFQKRFHDEIDRLLGIMRIVTDLLLRTAVAKLEDFFQNHKALIGEPL